MKRRLVYILFLTFLVPVTGKAQTMEQINFVDYLKATCPLLKDDTCIRNAAKAYLNSTDVNTTREEYPLTGVSLLKIKGISMERKGFYVTMDQYGQILTDNGNGARHDEWVLYVKKFGKLSPGLLETLKSVTQDDKVPVGIWLSQKQSVTYKEV